MVMMASGKAALIRFSISLAAIAMVAAPFHAAWLNAVWAITC
jgi:hypothetical protein